MQAPTLVATKTLLERANEPINFIFGRLADGYDKLELLDGAGVMFSIDTVRGTQVWGRNYTDLQNGLHTVTARATLGTQTLSSAPVSFTVRIPAGIIYP